MSIRTTLRNVLDTYGRLHDWLSDSVESADSGDRTRLDLREHQTKLADMLEECVGACGQAQDALKDHDEQTNLEHAARHVVECWKGGDLAGAVRQLAESLEAIDESR